MKRTLLLVISILFICMSLFAQKNELIKVKAGTKLKDYFAPEERYLYPNFTEGEASFKNGKSFSYPFNFNFLSAEIEFINSNDTLIIMDKKELKAIAIKQDTFYYHTGYLQQIQAGSIKVYSKKFIKTKDILKEGAMGTVNRSAASESYSYLEGGTLYYDLVSTNELVLQREEHLYFSLTENDFKRFNRSNLFAVMPREKDELKRYIKTNKINFKSKKDLLELANYINKSLIKN